MIKIMKMSEIALEEILERTIPMSTVEDQVQAIISEVRTKGDEALYMYSEKFDKAKLNALEVSQEEIEQAYESVDEKFREILKEAAANIRAFHQNQVKSGFIYNERRGIVTGQKVQALKKVGIYVPGGTAAYPSTVLMNAIPAKIAGVEEIIMVTPPTGGKVNPVILAAAKIAQVDRVFQIGGAQAVAALAYGTESVPRVDKIVGPGNAYVAEAKKQVYGQVAIDMIAGPSEILIVADEKANPVYLAADLLSQAEHDKYAQAVLVCTDEKLALAVQAELERQIPLLPRAEIARFSIDNGGKIIVAATIEQALAVSNELAPEHLEICTDNPFDYLDLVEHAGSVFLGRYCPEAVGDYFAGANHTLPTGGTARFASPLSVDDFTKKTQYTYYTKEALQTDGAKIAYFADKEGLGAHAQSVRVRLEEEE